MLVVLKSRLIGSIIFILSQAYLKGSTMDRETFDATLRTLKNFKPFRPFTIAMVNGDRLEVDYPDALAYREGVALFVAPGRVSVWFDHEGVSQMIGDLAGQSPV
jgi:hypothetical protein